MLSQLKREVKSGVVLHVSRVAVVKFSSLLRVFPPGITVFLPLTNQYTGMERATSIAARPALVLAAK